MGSKKILLASYGGGHANMILPVFKSLQQRSDISPELMAFTGARFLFDESHVPYFSFKDTLEFQTSKRAAALGRQLVDNTTSLLPTEETIAYMGSSMEDLIQTHGETEAFELFNTHGRSAFLPVAFFKALLIREKYNLVVTTNSPRSEKALVYAAQELGIPTVVIVDLFDQREFADRTAHPGYGTRICVLNEYVKNEMIKLGRPADEIVVTGNPAFDKLAAPELQSEATEIRHARNWGDKKIILWARGNDLESLELSPIVEQRLADFARTSPDTILVIRPHPNENLTSLEFPRNAFVSTRHDPLPPLLQAADVVITMLSTVGLEGALLGKPLVQLRMTKNSHASPYVELGVAIGASSLEEMIDCVSTHLNEGQRSKNRNWSNTLGKAAANVSQVIQTLLEHRPA